MSKARGPYRVDPLGYKKANEALDKMAENARELGLDYELQDKDPDLIEQPAQQEPDELRHIGEQDCLLDVDEKAWRSLVENRGGCRCHISPPCGACSNPISEEEMNEVGYTYTSPQPAQRTWVGLTDDEIESIFNNWPTYHLDHEDFARAIEAILREKNS